MIRFLQLTFWAFIDIPWLVVLATAWPMTGIVLVGYGAFLVYEPAGYISVGSLLILDSLHASSTRGAPK